MTEALNLRLQVRHRQLVLQVNKALKLLDGNQPTIELDEFTLLRLELRNSVEALERETHLCVGKCNISQEDLAQQMEDQLKAESILARLDSMKAQQVPAAVGGNTHSHQTARLPKLDLPKYSGDVLKWTEFWDSFEANVHNKNLKDVEKLSYLQSALMGDALNTIAGLTATNNNYSVAIDLLLKRYGSSKRVVDAHYEALGQLRRASNNASDCRHTLNNIERHLRVLDSLGENVKSNHLRVVITGKFPEKVLYEVSLLTTGDDVEDLRKTLNRVVSAMEVADVSPANSSATTEALHFTSNKDRNLRGTSQGAPRGFKRKLQGTAMSYKRTRSECIFCQGNHYNDQCDKFKTLNARKVKLGGRCFNCFRRGHNARTCKMKRKCPQCQGAHNRALCPEKLPANTSSMNPDSQITKQIKNICSVSNVKSILQTATATAKPHNSDDKRTCRLLLDTGSQRSYITKNLASTLHLDTDTEELLIIYTFGCKSPSETASPSAKIDIETKRGVRRSMRVNIVPHITSRIPIQHIPAHFQVDVQADDDTVGQGIDLLIGNDYYFSFMRKDNKKIEDNLFLINTDFGWMLSGSVDTDEIENALTVITYCQCHGPACPYFSEPDLPLRTIDMKFLWALESIGISDSPKSDREEEAVKYFNATVQYSDGRYEVKWPWIHYPPELPSNFGLAYGRLKSLLRRLDAETMQDYQNILSEQLARGIIEVVEARPDNPEIPIHYLPHHIIKQGNKGRIVYDASARVKDQKSLNECLYKGPSMVEDMTALILTFRTGKIGIIADVEKAFLQVGLQNEDREVTRFLWVKDPSKETSVDNLLYLRFCRVPFGIISSPFLLTATIRYHLAKSNQSLLKKIADRCYVDNLVTNANNLEEATQMFQETKGAFEELSMNIRDWTSNSNEFLELIPESQKAKEKEDVKVLGLLWNLESDTLQLKLNDIFFEEETIQETKTKKDVLRMLARFYDPCGFIAPLILPAKLLFQEICNRKLKWDAVIPEELRETWKTVITNLSEAKNLKIPRHVGVGMPEQEVQYELHGFTDASKNSYAAVVYLKAITNQEVKVSFMMSKARVTPVEDKDVLKIPRLELLGYLIGSRLLKYIRLSLDVMIHKSYLWTDSLIVLSWMKSNKLLPPFVSRRINEIKQNKEVEFCYINTKMNPADVATRPELWLQKKDLWLNGPEFLSLARNLWPRNTTLGDRRNVCSAAEALDSDSPGVSTQEDPIPDGDLDDIEPVTSRSATDSIEKGATITAGPGTLLLNEVENIRRLQAENFPKEVEGKETHLTRNLGLFIDVDGILRCKGRMTNTSWSYDRKHPILLPRNCPFTSQIIQKTHESNYHVGVSHTLSIIREKYWIPQGRVEVQKILRKCPQCVRQGGGPYRLPPTPSLPAERANYSTPFTFTGVDYFGPMFVSTVSGKEKRWVCLFTCLAVRAIHMEVVKNLTAEECLLALRRFTATRSTPQLIVSDNALQFKLTSEVCTTGNLKWRFIPQLAPWHGGFYERLVALVKHCLKRTLEKQLLQDSQLLTVIKEVEAVVNTRPLVRVGSELAHVLRPSDFLSMGKCLEPGFPLNESDTFEGTNTKVDLISGWRRGQIMLAEFQRMFQDQYLASLRERYKNSCKQPRVKSDRDPKLGDLVQIKDDSNKNRYNWKVGKIVSLIKSRDGQCRIAKVKVGNSEFTRSIGHLYPLEDDIGPSSTEMERLSTPEEVDPKATELSHDMSRFAIDMTEGLGPAGEKSMEVNPHQPIQTESDPGHHLLEPVEAEEPANCEQDVTRHEDPSEPENAISKHSETVADSEKGKRGAAIRARQKIAEWTRHLMTLF